MIGITIREDAYNAILASLAAGARLFQPQRTISGYRIWLPRKACNLLFDNRRRGEDISDTIIRIAEAWCELGGSNGGAQVREHQ
jgi:hypothetical protein